MVMAISMECPGCRRFEQTGDFFHDKDEWNMYHKSGWINGVSDWQPREELKDMLKKMKEVWTQVQEMKLQNPSYPMPEWKLNKILSKKHKS